MKDSVKKRRALTLPELLIVIILIGVLAAIAVPNFRSGHHRADDRACYANMKTIAGALEMYSLDHAVNSILEGTDKGLKDYDKGVDHAVTYAILKKGGYLQSIPSHPGTNETPEKVYRIDENGSMYCKSKTDDFSKHVHGYIKKPKPPKN